jgi:hypothetical protein
MSAKMSEMMSGAARKREEVLRWRTEEERWRQ